MNGKYFNTSNSDYHDCHGLGEPSSAIKNKMLLLVERYESANCTKNIESLEVGPRHKYLTSLDAFLKALLWLLIMKRS